MSGSTILFGVLIIQIKPQLEKLLNLTNDSLTKEIRLTQDLMDLFIKYQVPSDLLSFDGDENASKETRLTVVNAYVKAMKDMIEDSKKQELVEAAQVKLKDVLDDPAPIVFLQTAEDSSTQSVVMSSL